MAETVPAVETRASVESPLNQTITDLRVMADRYRSSIHLPTQKDLDKLRKAPHIQEAIITELAEAVRLNDGHKRTWDAAMWYQRLKLPVPDEQLQTDLPKLIQECEEYMDTHHISYRPIKPIKPGMGRRGFMKAAVAAVGLAATAGGVGTGFISYGRQTKAIPKPTFEPVGPPPPAATSEPTPAPTAEPTPEPTPEPKEEKIGDLNLAEYLLGGLIDRYKARRIERFHHEGGFKERIHHELLNSDQMTFLLLGTDEMRERADYFSGIGGGRSDVIDLISFNPHNFRLLRIAIPRDMLAPELGNFIRDPKFSALFDDGGPRITNMTQTARVAGFDSMDLVRQIIESALGIPVDQIIKFNLDATQGYSAEGNFHPGFFDAVIPEGLEINVQTPVVSADSGKVVIPAGRQILHGMKLTEFVRIRPKSGGGDFDRTNRREQVIKATFIHLAKNMLEEYIFKGDVSKLDKLINFLQTKKNNGDIFDYERDLVKDAAVIRGTIIKLRESRQGQAVLAALAANTADKVNNLLKQMVFYSFNRENLIASVQAGEANTFGNLYLLKPKGSSTGSRPTEAGFLGYWAPFRQKGKELINQII